MTSAENPKSDRDFIEQRIRALLKMREDGDLAGLLSLAAPDIIYDIRGNWSAFPFSEPVRGKEMTAQALMMIAVHCENLGNVLHDIVIDGDKVALRRTATIRHRGTGKVGTVEISDFVRFRDGLVVELVESADPVTLAWLESSD
jgi:ketosteroid isomerase-like protein